MASARKWAAIISYIASSAYFHIIILQIPLFRVPCGAGICTSPVEVTSYHLIANEVCPPFVVKALVYPGAFANAILRNNAVPSFHTVLNTYPNFNKLKNSDNNLNLRCIEVLVGSYFSVAGALMGALRPGRMSLVGTLLILWGLKEEIFQGRRSHKAPRKVVSVYPMMFLTSVLAFLSIKRDLRKLIRCFRARRYRRAKHY
ncbi:hypothetical protein NMG60_11002650 [Bertholletia excelsa]